MASQNKLYYKICREQAGLTQEQAIVLLGIAEPATLSRYENGHTPVSQNWQQQWLKFIEHHYLQAGMLDILIQD